MRALGFTMLISSALCGIAAIWQHHDIAQLSGTGGVLFGVGAVITRLAARRG